MPLYEYHCSKCGKNFETLQKFSDEPLKVHQECGGPVERLLSAPAFHLKGSGWYATDYAKTSGASKPAADTSSKPAETKTDTPTTPATTESKPAEK